MFPVNVQDGSSSHSTLIATFVHWIALIPFGKLDFAANCIMMLACLAAVPGNLIYLLVKQMMPDHTVGMIQQRDHYH